MPTMDPTTHCNTLQHTATHCNTLHTLQHTATHCNTLQQNAMYHVSFTSFRTQWKLHNMPTMCVRVFLWVYVFVFGVCTFQNSLPAVPHAYNPLCCSVLQWLASSRTHCKAACQQIPPHNLIAGYCNQIPGRLLQSTSCDQVVCTYVCMFVDYKLDRRNLIAVTYKHTFIAVTYKHTYIAVTYKHTWSQKLDSCNGLASVSRIKLWVSFSIKLWVSFTKEPYKRDYILQKRPIV